MIHIAICDDEPEIVKSLECIVKEYMDRQQECCSLFTCNDGARLLEAAKIFHIVLLDIEMPGCGGIQTAGKIREKSLLTKVIFITGLPKYQYDAFSVHAFSYILKPFSASDVERQLVEAILALEGRRHAELRFLTACGGVELCREEDVLYFESVQRKVVMATRKGKIQLRATLSAISQQLANYNFACPHNSFLVNLFHVHQIVGNTVFMDNRETIPLAQKKASLFRSQFHNFLDATFFSDIAFR